MRGRTFFVALTAAALLANAGVAWGQKAPYGVEEYNAYVDTTQPQDAKERLQVIETFLKNYPESVLRAFVYPNYLKTAYELQDPEAVSKAVDGFWRMDRAEVVDLYKQSNYTDQQIDAAYYEMVLFHTYSFLRSFRNGPNADAKAAKAADYARQGLKLHEELYNQVQPPADAAQREQFEANKRQQEAAMHSVLAFVAWRSKDYAAAQREYGVLVKFTPEDPTINYRLGLANLQLAERASGSVREDRMLSGFWYVARSVGLNVPKSAEVKQFLTNSIAAYQQVLPECIEKNVDTLVTGSGESVSLPAGWSLVSADQVNAVREQMDVKRILDDLKAGGERAEVMWLASCGSEIGSSEEGVPQLAVLVLDVTESEDNLVTLRVAAGQEAADAKLANMEVKVSGPPEAKRIKVDDVVRVSGTIGGFQNEPEFRLKLKEGKVNAEDIPKTR